MTQTRGRWKVDAAFSSGSPKCNLREQTSPSHLKFRSTQHPFQILAFLIGVASKADLDQIMLELFYILLKHRLIQIQIWNMTKSI